MTTSTRPSHNDRADPAEPRTLRRDASENRRRILDAARAVFAKRGLEAGVEEIAHTAKVGMGTLYRRFPTKDALIAELVHALMEEMVILARQAEKVPDGRGLEQFLYALGEAQTANRGCLARIWTDDRSTALRAEYRTAITTLMADATANDTVRKDAAVTDIDLIFWSLRGIIEATGEVSTTAWRRHVAIALAGLRPSDESLPEAPISDELVARVRESALRG